MQVGYARVSTSENIDEKYQNYVGKWGIFKREHKNFISKLKRTENYKGIEGGFSFEPLTKEEIKILNLE